MKKPDLNRMWETFVKLSWEDVSMGGHINMLRKKIHPLLSDLEKKEIIDWNCFLIHDKDSGGPTSRADLNVYFHIRFSVVKDTDKVDFLPKYCLLARKIPLASVNTITGIDKALLKNEEIEEAWRIIGEQS